jgi:hypothetical protein
MVVWAKWIKFWHISQSKRCKALSPTKELVGEKKLMPTLPSLKFPSKYLCRYLVYSTWVGIYVYN